MLNKKQVIEVMRKSKLPADKVWVGFGSAMCMHGLKETTKDIDAQCDHELFERLIKLGFIPKEAPMGGRMIVFNKYLDLFENMGKPEGTEFIDGVQVDSLEKICEWKKARGREKDMKDIELIEKHLQGRTH